MHLENSDRALAADKKMSYWQKHAFHFYKSIICKEPYHTTDKESSFIGCTFILTTIVLQTIYILSFSAVKFSSQNQLLFVKCELSCLVEQNQ